MSTGYAQEQFMSWNFTVYSKGICKSKVVGDARFELATPWTQTKCATKLR